MPTPEGQVKAKVKRILKEFEPKVYAFWPVQTGYGAATLDCLGCANGRAFAIETKAPGKKPTKRQEAIIEEMTDAKKKVFVIDGDPVGYNYLRSWLEHECKIRP